MLFGPINKITLIELQKKLFARSSSGNNNYNILLGISAAASAVKLQHALELLETQTLTSFNTYLKKLLKEASQGKSKGVQRLIKKPEFNQAYIISSELLTKNIEHPKIQKTIELIKEELDILGNSSQDEITCFRFGKVRAIKSARQLRDKYFRSIRDRIRGYEEFIDNIELDKEKDDIRYFGFFYGINFVYVREFNKFYNSRFNSQNESSSGEATE